MQPAAPSFSRRPLLSAGEIAGTNLFFAVLRASIGLQVEVERLFKAHGLTAQQYNALAVLREAGPQGLMCRELGSGLLQRDPDITRLAERLEEHGWIAKQRSESDRRAVRLRLTTCGLHLVETIDEPLNQLHAEHSAVFEPHEVQSLIRNLEKLRAALPQGCCTANPQPTCLTLQAPPNSGE